MIANRLDAIHCPWPRPLPRDPCCLAEVSPVAFDVAEAGGLEELDVPVGGDGDSSRSRKAGREVRLPHYRRGEARRGGRMGRRTWVGLRYPHSGRVLPADPRFGLLLGRTGHPHTCLSQRGAGRTGWGLFRVVAHRANGSAGPPDGGWCFHYQVRAIAKVLVRGLCSAKWALWPRLTS